MNLIIYYNSETSTQAFIALAFQLSFSIRRPQFVCFPLWSQMFVLAQEIFTGPATAPVEADGENGFGQSK